MANVVSHNLQFWGGCLCKSTHADFYQQFRLLCLVVRNTWEFYIHSLETDMKGMQPVCMHNNCKNIPGRYRPCGNVGLQDGWPTQAVPSGSSDLDQQPTFKIFCNRYLVSSCIYLLPLHIHLFHFFFTRHLVFSHPQKAVIFCLWFLSSIQLSPTHGYQCFYTVS